MIFLREGPRRRIGDFDLHNISQDHDVNTFSSILLVAGELEIDFRDQGRQFTFLPRSEPISHRCTPVSQKRQEDHVLHGHAIYVATADKEAADQVATARSPACSLARSARNSPTGTHKRGRSGDDSDTPPSQAAPKH